MEQFGSGTFCGREGSDPTIEVSVSIGERPEQAGENSKKPGPTLLDSNGQR